MASSNKPHYKVFKPGCISFCNGAQPKPMMTPIGAHFSKGFRKRLRRQFK